MYYLSDTQVPEFAARLTENGTVYVPRSNDRKYHLEKLSDSGETQIEINEYRTEVPYLKSFLFNPKCVVARYPGDSGSNGQPPDEGKVYLWGIKACDIQGKKVLDEVFLQGEYVDTFYKKRKENTIIISSDCTGAKDTCYCTMLGSQPYPIEGFDINLSPVDGGLLVEPGSEEGNRIISSNSDLLQSATDEQTGLRERKRNELADAINNQNRDVETNAESRRQSIQRNLNSQPVWDKNSQTCVACNACNYVCPTCYCFLLNDQKADGNNERIKVWDSCFNAGHARMAGGLTPRLRLVERFKNHYYHKFDSYVTNFGYEACSGCGRCIDACSGNIDKRKVLKDIERYVELQ